MACALRVLVVEDDPDTATSYDILLRLYGYQVGVALDGPSALRAVQVNEPDVVLIDIGLPKMDGWQVAKQIREQNARKRPFLIAITGYGTLADRLRSQEAGIDLHLLKPVDMASVDQLLRRFQEVMFPAPRLAAILSMKPIPQAADTNSPESQRVMACTA